jgi:ACS family D-galactonate transporter-like MFS transporter
MRRMLARLWWGWILAVGPNHRPGSALLSVFFLLFLSILINYIDRGNLSIAAPLLKDELRISASQLGVLFSAFFWTYSAMQIVSGWIIDRYDVNWVLAAGFVLWSMATTATGLVHGFAMLIGVRMVLGAAESVAFPSYGKIICLHVPEQHRGMANAVIIAGMSAGPAVGTYGCGMAMARYGWRPVFIVLGLVSLIWVAPWLRWMPKTTINEQCVTTTISAADIFRQRSFWGASVGHFCIAYPWYFILLWLPLYLVRERHQSMRDMALHAALFFVIYALVAPITGCIADACIRAGADVTTIRKTFMAIGHSLVVLGVLACAASDARLSFTGMLVMGGGLGFTGPNIFAFAQAFAGPAAAGKWIGMQNSLGNVSGVVVGPLTGLIVDRTGHFGWAFVVCAVVTFVGGIAWTRVVGRLEQVPWRAESHAAAVGSARKMA